MIATDRHRGGAKHGNWWRFPVAMLALAAFHAGPAGAQATPAADPLPSVIYPFPVPATGQRDNGVPEPVPVAVERPPDQYVLIDGVWGYWDLDRHFHPKLTEPANGPTTDLPKATAIPGDAPTETRPGLSVRRYAASLPNPPVRAIVVRPASAPEHGPVH